MTSTSESDGYRPSAADNAPVNGRVLTNDQIADQLVTDYWEWLNGGSWRAFQLDASRTLTVNLSGLTDDGMYLARAALRSWSDVANIEFVETTGTAAITIDDNEHGAFARAKPYDHKVLSARVNVDVDWTIKSGANFASVAYQTFVHEIGHALGLGHSGNYDKGATFGIDNHYDNDSWQASVMSYFSQNENSFVNADYGYVLTPQVADIIAIQRLYGPAADTRAGDTVYGFGNNSGNPVYGTDFSRNVTLAIYDTGGNDTLDYSGYAAGQRIDLRPEAASNIGGFTGNIQIARGTIIENAVGGSGNDLFFGNQADNRIDGGSGADRVAYADSRGGYGIELTTTGDIIVTDINPANGNDGRDVLTGIESLSFAGVVVNPPTSPTTASAWQQDASDVKLVAATWQLFMQEIPSQAGFQYLIQSAANPTDLNDPYFVSFNEENRYIAFASNLGTKTPQGKAWFLAEYGSLSYDQAVDKAFGAVISAAGPGDDGAAAKAFFINAEAYFEAVAAERVVRPGIDLDDATKLVMLSSMLHESVKVDVGVYAEPVTDFATVLAASGTSPFFGQSLFDTA